MLRASTTFRVFREGRQRRWPGVHAFYTLAGKGSSPVHATKKEFKRYASSETHTVFLSLLLSLKLFLFFFSFLAKKTGRPLKSGFKHTKRTESNLQCALGSFHCTIPVRKTQSSWIAREYYKSVTFLENSKPNRQH